MPKFKSCLEPLSSLLKRQLTTMDISVHTYKNARLLAVPRSPSSPEQPLWGEIFVGRDGEPFILRESTKFVVFCLFNNALNNLYEEHGFLCEMLSQHFSTRE